MRVEKFSKTEEISELLEKLKRVRSRHQTQFCVVSGDFPARKMLQNLLSMGQMPSCQGFDKGAQALGMLAKTGKNLVFFYDMATPDLNGVQFLAALAKAGVKERVGVVLLSGSLNDQAQEKLQSMGALAFITKPIKQEAVFQVLGLLGFAPG